ncbi:MAG: hypothetical protein HYY85_18115, partial [Deltaproteobacteria bacterium]|nr:hypothetical protein [Deltaproteobacteria bacterium]
MVLAQPGRLIRVTDLGPVRAFLDARPLENLKLRGFLEQAPPDYEAIWVDDPRSPQAVVIRGNEWYNVAVADGSAARQVFISLEPSEDGLKFAGLPRGLVNVLEESHDVIRENLCYLYYLRPERFRPQLRHPAQSLRLDDA